MCKDLNESNIKAIERVKILMALNPEILKLSTSVAIFTRAVYTLGWEVYSNDITYEYYDIIYRHPDYDFVYKVYGDIFDINIYIKKLSIEKVYE